MRWGAQTFDEMHLGYVEKYIPNAKHGESTSPNGGRHSIAGSGRPGFDLETIFKRLDRNSDGKLVGDEIPAAQREKLMRLDTNQDGAVSQEEAERLRC